MNPEKFNPATHRKEYGKMEAEIEGVNEKITGEKNAEELGLVVKRDELVENLNAQREAAEDAAREDNKNLPNAQEQVKKLTADIEAYNKQIQEITGVENAEMVPFSAEEARAWFAKRKQESGSIADLDENLIEYGVANVHIDRTQSMEKLFIRSSIRSSESAGDSFFNAAIRNRKVEDGPSDLQVFFVTFHKKMKREEMIEELAKLGLRPVTAAELIVIGGIPKMKRQHRLASLFSTVIPNDDRYSREHIPYLKLDDNNRYRADLRMEALGAWGDNDRFPAVRK